MASCNGTDNQIFLDGMVRVGELCENVAKLADFLDDPEVVFSCSCTGCPVPDCDQGVHPCASLIAKEIRSWAEVPDKGKVKK